MGPLGLLAVGQVKRKSTTPLTNEGTRKINQFKEKACRRVRAHCLLVVEDAKFEGMKKTLANTALPDWTGETINNNTECPGISLARLSLFCLTP